MFVCVSPSESDAGESLCSLNFAGRVRNVELGPAKRKAEGGGKAAAEQARKAAEEADRRESRIRQLEAELQQQAAAGVGSLRAACLPLCPPLPSSASLRAAGVSILSRVSRRSRRRERRQGGSGAEAGAREQGGAGRQPSHGQARRPVASLARLSEAFKHSRKSG